MLTPLNDYFGDLDGKDFVGIKETADDTYVYNATDVLVQTTWELPIVIQYPESTVQFEFCSNPGDISFGIVFVAAPEEGQDLNDLELETVEEMGLVRSNLEAVSGSFEVPCEGVVFFMWDNNYDWSATKKISYLIEVKQPAFKYADLLRVDKCLPLLGETVEDLNAAYVRSADAQDCIEHNTANVTFLEDQMATLQRKLLAKQTEKAVLDREIDQLEKTVELGIVLTPGLCIRQLEKSLLTHVLSFLNPAGGVNRVCKYWSQLAADVRQQVSNSPQKAAAPARVLHRTKSEVKTALAQIKSGIMLRELTRQQAAKMMAAVSAGDAAQLTGHSNHNSPSKAGSVAHGTVTPALSANSIAGHSHTTAVSSVGESTAAVTGGAAARKSPGASPAAASPKLHKAGEDVEVSDTSESDDSERDEKKAGAAGAAEFNHTTLHRTNSSKSNSGNVRVSFDNILPANTHAHNQSFTTKVSAVQATPTDKKKKGSGMAGGTANAISQKHLPQPPQEEAAREVTNFVNNLQWGRERPSNAGGAAQQGSPQGRSKREDRKTGGHHAAGVADTTEPTLPAVAESKKKSRVKLTSKSAQLPPPTGGSTAQSKKMGPSGLPDNENSRNLLLHVKKVRSEQQMNAMIEYLQAGFIKIETLTTEKRRIKKLIKAWNASFEKNNSRLPTSSERKGHLRELYEEYHQVSLALRIRTEKMEDSLRTVGLTQDEFLALRDRKQNDW